MRGTGKTRISAKRILLIIAAAALAALLIRACFPERLFELDPDDYTSIGIRSYHNGAWVEIDDRDEIEAITERLNNFGYLWRVRNHTWTGNGNGYGLNFYGDNDKKVELSVVVWSGYIQMREASDKNEIYNYYALNIFYFDNFVDYF